jgi:ComF family protein
LYAAEGQVREIIHQFKYQDRFYWLERLGGWLVESYEAFAVGETWDALVPVPLHSKRQRDRGFNQAEELAQLLSRHCGVPVWRGMRRVRETATQANLSRRERLRNPQGAFALRRGFDLPGVRLLVIDDVLTTGSTMDACARTLLEAGAGRVAGLAVARG